MVRRNGVSLPHCIWRTGGGAFLCQRCGCQWTESSHNKTRKLQCRGCPSGRLLAKRHGDVSWLQDTMAISNSELDNRGARPVQEPEYGRQSNEEVQGAAEDTPRAAEDLSEEDPFGHLQSGFDDSLPGSATLERSTRAVPAASERQRGEGAADHVIRTRGAAAWCEVCGRYALARVGTGLAGRCGGVLGSYAVRLTRLRAGRHPLTGNPL